MYGTSPEMLQRMYVKGSLQNQDNGFVFQIKNLIESGSLSGIAKVAVDDEERDLEGATMTIYVPGTLAAGEHTVTTQFNVPELGRLSMPITDTVA